ncbi:unnamed protein product [Acanthoscelides obtectus]|uniref:Uncharacterized protein n=1 Tax=Acanthoscelides obtectus TaxID=200917 RepID=A0A9P0PU08_ACAOB|nr:unnamed protein product [Acanthoscelides obtectus]CAK1644829.1 hypothetical protein AOBTE_LOCUS13952 [Acanthoscelides obtectus]
MLDIYQCSDNSVICNTSEQLSLGSLNEQKTFSSNQSSGSNIQYTPSVSSAPPYHCIENSERLSLSDLSLSEVMESSENLTTSQTSVSFPASASKNSLSPNVSPTQVYDRSAEDLLNTDNKLTSDGLSTDNLSLDPDVWNEDRPSGVNLIDFSPVETKAEVCTIIINIA